MLQRRERPVTVRSTSGEPSLPGGRVLPLALLLSLSLLSCAAPVAADRAVASPSPDRAAVPTAGGGIPMLGTTPPSGLVFQTYFVTLTDAKNGSVGVLTTPGSRCTLAVSAPDGAISDLPAQTVGADGTATFAYPPASGHGESIQTVRCALGEASQVAKGRVPLP